MKFTLSAEQLAFAESIGELLSDADTPSVIRAWADGDHAPGLAVWKRLADLGVHGLMVAEEHGGLGAGPVDLAVAFEALGYHGVPGPWVESVAALPVLLLADDDLPAQWLPALASGHVIGTLAMPPEVPYALDADVAELRAYVVDGVLHTFTPEGSVASVDPTRRLFVVDDAVLEPVCPCADMAAAAADLAVLAVSAQVLGAGRRMLEMSVEYAKQRVQYGRAIGSYQAVKHLLADVVTQLELARPLLFGAAVALTDGADTADRDVSAARVACADAAYLSARTALQIHGAIGYTLEHDLGLWFTKVRALRSAWGTQSFHRARVLEALTAAGLT